MVQRVKMTTIEQTTATETMEVVQVILHTQQTKVRYSVTECVLCISSLPRYFHHFFPSNPIQHRSNVPKSFLSNSNPKWIDFWILFLALLSLLFTGRSPKCLLLSD